MTAINPTRGANQNNNRHSQKELEGFSRLQEVELDCLKQIKALYGKLSKAFERGVSLQSQKRQLQETKIHLSSSSDPTEQNLYRQLVKSKQEYKSAELQYASITKDLISNSAKIKEITKQINSTKGSITQKQQLYEQMKNQTQKLRQREIQSTKNLIELQQSIKRETLKKIALMKIQTSEKTPSKRQQIMQKISEMKRVNELLSQMLTL